jgi:antiviral helicase SKI2
MDETQRQKVLEKFEKALFANIDRIPLLGLHKLQQVIPYQVNPTALLDVTLLGDVSRLEFIRDSSTSELLDLNEEPLKAGDDFHYDLTSKSSVSMKRCATSTQTITGSITSLPFKPPALDLVDSISEVNKQSSERISINDFLRHELDNQETTIPGTNVKNSFDCEEPNRDELIQLSEADDQELNDWIQSENTRYDCLGTIIEKANMLSEKSVDSDAGTLDAKKEKALEKEMNKLVNRVLNISIKDVDLEEDKSSEFAKVVNISKEPDEEISNPAKTYDFKLDPFQKQAILHMEKFCNVFVAAHTSAGKTVVAEYAIAMARRSMTKVVYTSPIKALSNQKYRDFTLEFGDVGLITGDVQVNTDASCLILTTEILLQMLDNGSDLIRDLEWAIFDEVHYVNDEERGHVWERIFIMLPEHVNLVLLSATVPNVIKFAEWLGRIRKKPTVVITTAKRPVPLEHYLYTGSSAKTMDQRYKFIDHASNFVLEGYKKAIDAKKDTVKHVKGAKGKAFYSNPQQDKNIYVTLVRHLENLSLLPVICFTFSRRRCDANARMLQSLDLTTGEEKARIHKFVTRSLDRFKESDRKLRQVVALKEMLKRGFGVHHSGVLPLLKEITEILFCDGLVKVLFATETFAMGVNMPARSVVFDSIKKHDGRYRRYLLPSEYIQMAGRAGRRGKDSVGTVIVLCKKEVPEASDLINIALGKPTPLESRFQLKYSMILTLLRARHHLKVESVIGKSFIEHDKQASLASEQVRQQALLKKIDSFRQPDCDMCLDGRMDEFCEHYLRYMTSPMNEEIRIEVFKHIYGKKKIIQGKTMCIIGLETNPAALGVIVQVFDTLNPPAVEVLYLKDYTSGKVEYNKSLGYHQILFVLKDTINSNWIELNREKDQLQNGKAIAKASQQLRNYLLKLKAPLELLRAPSFHPYNDLNLRDLEFVDAYDKYEVEQAELRNFGCWSCTQFIQHFQLFFRKHYNLYEVNRINFLLSPESLFFLPEYKRKLEVLRVLHYINEENVPELKAKVACLMSVHELVITEMLTENMLSDCTPAEIAALLSVFVYQQKQREEDVAEKEKKPTTRLEKKCLELVKIAENIGKIQRECGIDQSVEDFVDTLKFGLVDVVHKWAEGSSFSELLKITEEQEGIIVRCIQRLDEVLRAVKAACKLIGYPDICERIEIANQSINRDIVFAASLYVCSLQSNEEEIDAETVEAIGQEMQAEESADLVQPEEDAADQGSESE